MKSFATFFGMFLMWMAPWTSASAAPPPPDTSCYVTANADANGILHVHFPAVVQMTAKSTPGVAPPIFAADLEQVAPGSMNFQLWYSGVQMVPIADNCQAQQLFTNTAGNFGAFVPQGIFGTTPFSATLNQNGPNSQTFAAVPAGPAPISSSPSGQFKCGGVTHYSDYSVINPVIFNIANVDSASKRTVKWTSDNGLAPQGGGFSYGTVDPNGGFGLGLTLAAAGQSYVINNYGTYTGTFSVTTAVGTAIVNWSVTATSAEVACSVNPS